MEIGLVGLPNVGKSTLFNALTAANAAASNFPFCTIEPNVGVAILKDARLDRIAEIFKPPKVTPATVRFVDIAGLVKDAHKGEGLGNQFLAHIREVDAICQVVRCFADPGIIHVYGDVDPERDVDLIDLELGFADAETVAKRIARVEKAVKGDRALQPELDWLRGMAAHLAAGRQARSFATPEEMRPVRKELSLLTAKPLMFAANVAEADLPEGNEAVEKLRQRGEVVVASAAVEAEIAQMPEEERKDFLASINLAESGLDRLAHAAYRTLGFETFFTAGDKEARAWPFQRGSFAPQCAGLIHSDFERGFIRAEVVSFEDLDRLGSWATARDQGKLRSEGREYVIKDGDIPLFRFAV